MADPGADAVIAAVLECRVLERRVPERRVLERSASRSLPFLWHIDPTSRPVDLAQRLEAQGGKRLPPGVCMGAGLFSLNEAARVVPGLVIERMMDEVQYS